MPCGDYSIHSSKEFERRRNEVRTATYTNFALYSLFAFSCVVFHKTNNYTISQRKRKGTQVNHLIIG